MGKQPYVLGSLTARDVEIIVLRTRGIKPREIAQLFGVSRHAIYQVISRVYRVSGTSNTAQLTHWAVENALDAGMPPERDEDTPKTAPKVRKRIRVNRIPRGSCARR